MENDIQVKLKTLPDEPGVYLFFNTNKELIYVGKASSLRSRVKSYFSGKKSPRPIEDLIHEVVDLRTYSTDSALEAAILEGAYIKKYYPKYNIQWRDDKSWNFITISKDEFPKIGTIRQHELTNYKKKEFKYIYGPYPNLNTREALRILRKIFLFTDCDASYKKPCFYYQIGQCLGVCTNEISATDYVSKVIKPLRMLLAGQKKILIKKIEKEMKIVAKAHNYEEAARLRNQIHHLQKIHDIALLNESFMKDILPTSELNIKRIEGYDISNLGSTDMVGSMVVFDNHGAVKSQYRKFNIKSVEGQSDVDSLGEVLERRLKHLEWPLPDIFMIDGGLPQVNKSCSILRAAGVNVPVVGIAKGPARKRNDFFVVCSNIEINKWINRHKSLLVRVRDEAHRFAITFNRSKRKLKH